MTRHPNHRLVKAGIAKREQIADFLRPMLTEGSALPTTQHIASLIGVSIRRAEWHYSLVLEELGVETRMTRRTMRVVESVGREYS